MSVIDATNNSAIQLSVITPLSVAVNPVTGRIYVGSDMTMTTADTISVLTPAPTASIPLNVTATTPAGNTVNTRTPTFTLTATSSYSPNAPAPQNIYFQIDSTAGTWTRATPTGSTASTLTATATTPALTKGIHTIYYFATDGSDATSINPFAGDDRGFGAKNFEDSPVPQLSPVTGGIGAMQFLVGNPLPPTAAAATVSGRILTPDGAGLAKASVILTDSNGNSRTAVSGSLGYYRFDDVSVGATYVLSVSSKHHQFNPQVVTVMEDIENLDFRAVQ